MSLRSITGAALAALGAWALYAIFVAPEPPAEPVVWASSRQCAECHAQANAEWAGSWHAQAWTDVEVRRQSEDYARKDCIDCHAPQPVFSVGLGERVLPRNTRRIEGVDCIACHLMPDGRVAGTVDNPSAACRPIANRDLIRPEFCAGCHNQHGTVDQWKASRFAQEGPDRRDCLDCHMPYRNGDPAQGRDHTMHGGHDIELVRSAVELRARRDGAAVRVEVENVGAGHNYPTDERSRASDLFWRAVGPGDAFGEWRHLHRFRNPYRHEVGLENTELASGATFSALIDAPEASGEVEVALFYKLTPYYQQHDAPDPEREATLVHSLRVAP